MSARPYPYHFQCKECGAFTLVKRSDALRLYDDPDNSKALSAVLEHRGWEQELDGVLCSNCTGGSNCAGGED